MNSKTSAEELLATFFEILEDVAHIDLFQDSDMVRESKSSEEYELKYNGQSIKNNIAIQVYIEFVSELWNNKNLGYKLKKYVVDERATYKDILGSKPNIASNGHPDSIEIAPDVHLYRGLSVKSITKEIEKVANWLGIEIEKNIL